MTARWQLCTYMDYSLSEDLFFLSFPRPHFCLVRHHRCETGNGLAFQFFFCWAVWLVGLGVGVYRGFPSTPPLALLGGVLWSTGNLLSVPAIKLIGLGLSLLIWGISNMCVGWVSSTFGILGVEKQQVSKPVLNYAGAATALLALLVYLVVKPTDSTRDASSASSRRAHRRKRMPHRLASPALRSSLLIERDEEEDDEEGVLGGTSGARGGRGLTGDGRDEHGGRWAGNIWPARVNKILPLGVSLLRTSGNSDHDPPLTPPCPFSFLTLPSGRIPSLRHRASPRLPWGLGGPPGRPLLRRLLQPLLPHHGPRRRA